MGCGCSLVRRSAVIGIVALARAGAARVAGAQVITGTVEGRVKDMQGGVLPGVTITAVSTATSATYAAATTTEGHYRLPFLPSGTYDIRADLSGFRSETRTGRRGSRER